MTPNWLKVDNATIFFKSDSRKAENLAIKVVIAPNAPIIIKIFVLLTEGKTRNNKYTPAVTSVEECTKADTGVGAAIAAGSQALKGTWALFVIAATIKAPKVRFAGPMPAIVLIGKVNDLNGSISEREIRISASPTRLVRAVRRPALKALLLL